MTFADVAAYNDLMGDGLTPWEIETIIRLDLERKQSD